MRKIDKGEPIESFSEFVNAHPHATWDDAKGESWKWREYILGKEQHCLSGYTEETLRLDGSHIDHFRKKSLFNTLIFDWNNLIVDGLNETYGAKYKDKVVRNHSDNERLVNPVTEDPSRYFKYELNGNISVLEGLSPTDLDRARYTIDAFNLNEASLAERRRIIINTRLDSYNDLSDELILEALSAVGFKSVVEQLLNEHKQEEGSHDEQ